MSSSVRVESVSSNWQDLPLVHTPNEEQLCQIQRRLDVLFLALIALTELEVSLVEQSVQELHLKHLSLELGTAETLSHPSQWGSCLDRPLSLEAARSLVLIICHLAQKHQELLRRAVTLMEQMQEQGKDAAKTALLGEYLERFRGFYQDYQAIAVVETRDWERFAFKQLIDLMFYGAINGHRRLWLVLLEKVQGWGNETAG
jgi:hypothetical protein